MLDISLFQKNSRTFPSSSWQVEAFTLPETLGRGVWSLFSTKLSTWCQKLQNCSPDVKKFTIFHMMSKNSKWPPDVKIFKIVHLMSKNSKLSSHLMSKKSKLSTWCKKIQNCPPDVKIFKIVQLMSKKSKLSTCCSQFRDTRYPQPIKTHNMNCNTHALAIRDDCNPSIHLVIQRQSAVMLVFVTQGIWQLRMSDFAKTKKHSSFHQRAKVAFFNQSVTF